MGLLPDEADYNLQNHLTFNWSDLNIDSMYYLTVKSKFAAAHRIVGYEGCCAQFHGHNFGVEVMVGAEKLNGLGMAIDFKKLKGLVDGVISEFDHQDLNELPHFHEVNPTSESLAKYIYDRLKPLILPPLALSSVTVSETEGYQVTYREGFGISKNSQTGG